MKHKMNNIEVTTKNETIYNFNYSKSNMSQYTIPSKKFTNSF